MTLVQVDVARHVTFTSTMTKPKRAPGKESHSYIAVYNTILLRGRYICSWRPALIRLSGASSPESKRATGRVLASERSTWPAFFPR